MDKPQVLKRDGATRQEFDFSKVFVAIRKAATSSGESISDDAIVEVVESICYTRFFSKPTVGVEEIQDAVEISLMKAGFAKTAKAYILYRESRSDARKNRLTPDSNMLGDYIHPGKYARYMPDLKRREVYLETVNRDEAMHLRRFEGQEEVIKEIRWAFDKVRAKKVLPSMRSMQFAGEAIERNNCRIFNCTFSFCDRPRFFSEAIYLLLCGCGVGFSVQYEHIEKLPELKQINHDKVRHHVVADSIEGWADAVDRLFDSYLKGYYVEFSFYKIRAKGAPLKISGGKAPGHMKLKDSLEKIRIILNIAQGRQLQPIECYDIMCHLAAAVLSGGIRRSAMICLFSLEDSEMMNAKPKFYYQDMPGRPATPWRGFSNNSVMLKRDEVTKKTFRRVFKMTRQAGEPGFYFCFDLDMGTNPCVEIGLLCKLLLNDETFAIMEDWIREALAGKFLHTQDDPIEVHAERVQALEWAKKHEGDTQVGWAFCNLSTQNASLFNTFEDFLEAAMAAAIIGTIQASYTRMPYLGWVSEIIARRDALLGVSMTGIMGRPEIALDPVKQMAAAMIVNTTNSRLSKLIGTRPAARTTCVKPEGTGSKELGIPEEGIHASHSRRFIQCVLANEDEAVFKHFYKTNPHMCVKVPDSTNWAIYFPMQANEGAITRENISAIEFLQKVLSTQRNWVIPGTQRPEQTPGLTHNVSNTVTVRDDEWDAVADFIFANKNDFTGLSFLSFKSDKEYGPFAPKQSVVTDADEARWNELVRQCKPVNYLEMIEDEDGTELSAEPACAGGQCT